jgi:hypothetical protein
MTLIPEPDENYAEKAAMAMRWQAFSDLFDGYGVVTVERIKKGGRFEAYGDDMELGAKKNLDDLFDEIAKDLEEEEGAD